MDKTTIAYYTKHNKVNLVKNNIVDKQRNYYLLALRTFVGTINDKVHKFTTFVKVQVSF